MSDRHIDHLLIGGGVAAASCARTLRERGADGTIAIVGREADPPYHRPPATKTYLLGQQSREETWVAAPEWYRQADVELLTRTSVMGLDPQARTARLSSREEVSFGTALVATGAMVRRLEVDGAQLDGIHYVRALGNADAVRADAESADRVVCVGGSYLGCEIAASLTDLGRRCTVVMLEDEPMDRGFGRNVGRAVRRVLDDHGVEVIGGAGVERFEGDERVRAVVLSDGRTLEADLVVCGTGARPDAMLARRAGLALGPTGGVLCDARLESTSAPGVFAAGDVCEHHSALLDRTIRVEHEDVAVAQGATAAANMLGAGEPFRTVPTFWTELAGWLRLDYVGLADGWDEEIVTGALDDAAFGVSYVRDGRVVAVLSAGGHVDLDDAREHIAAGGPLDHVLT